MGTSKSHIGYRDASTGQFVKENYAKQHPRTTEREHVPNPGRSITGRNNHSGNGKKK